MNIEIKFATSKDTSLILHFIKQLAEYEKLLDEVVVTEEILHNKLFGEKQYAEVLIAYIEQTTVGFALFFHNFSTFLGKPGIYLEDLFVIPKMRGLGIAKKILSFLANLALERDCARIEWSVLNWNKPAIDFYKSIGAKPMDEWTVNRITGVALHNLANLANISKGK